jgi:hypothetical protein
VADLGALRIVEQDADVSGFSRRDLDLNKDGRPDAYQFVEIVEGQPRVVRKEVDVNFDGKIDIIRKMDAKGDLVEERIDGQEISFHVIADGERYVVLGAAQDHKRLRDGDNGPNTGGMGAFSPVPVCTPRLVARICAEVAQICVYFDSNPDGDTVSFDSVSRAMLPILQAITFDTWTDPMFYVKDAYSFAAWGYFIAIAILGGMFVVNLFLAVIFDEFMRAQATEEAVEDLTSGATEGGGFGGRNQRSLQCGYGENSAKTNVR